MQMNKALKTDYFTRKREREVENVKFFGESNGFPFKNWHIFGPEGLMHGNAVLSRKILNILYDRQGPNTGFLILRTFEHLNSKT